MGLSVDQVTCMHMQEVSVCAFLHACVCMEGANVIMHFCMCVCAYISPCHYVFFCLGTKGVCQVHGVSYFPTACSSLLFKRGRP